MNNETLFDFENGVANCSHRFVHGPAVRGLSKIAQDTYGLGQLVHEEIVIRAQSLYRESYFIRCGHGRPIGFQVVPAIYHGGKEMKMLGTDMDSEPRPEQIEPGMTGCDIPGVQRRLKLSQPLIQSDVIVG